MPFVLNYGKWSQILAFCMYFQMVKQNCKIVLKNQYRFKKIFICQLKWHSTQKFKYLFMVTTKGTWYNSVLKNTFFLFKYLVTHMP